jgi:hypothetical protein
MHAEIIHLTRASRYFDFFPRPLTQFEITKAALSMARLSVAKVLLIFSLRTASFFFSVGRSMTLSVDLAHSEQFFLRAEWPQGGLFRPSCDPGVPFFRGCEEKGIFFKLFI